MLSFAHMHALSYADVLGETPDAQLVVIADENPASCREMAARFGAEAWTIEQLLNSDVEAIVVCSENTRHADHVVACAQAGKHVLCEKPLATTIADGERMIEACARAGVFLSTAFVCRYLPPIRRAWEMCRGGELGEIFAVKATNHGTMPGGWFAQKSLAGGGAVVDHTVHVADLLRWFLDSEPVSVYAEIDRLIHADLEVDDCGMLTIEFENGVFATIDPSWSRPGGYPFWGDVTVTLVGSDATVAVDGFGQVLTVHGRDAPSQWVHWGSSCDALMIGDFVAAIEKGQQPPITGQDGLRATQVVLAAYASAEAAQPLKPADLRP
ncbi:dehydrogenase [candidate division KD3-62 bacterium DG_56]|uniref:Dehydrogenase n=1 Tax=candidate division KD3-62 bacterium DG_56 TaxID=1704032 RepID=A0A0S7XRL4_9BACT|nr:MAG: dehydrogenase [candidate division KD3-62 bacterium DG_56]